MGVYLPHGFTDLTAQYVVDRYNKIIDEIDMEIYNDYIDNLVYNPILVNVFDIRYIPAVDNLRFYINGVLYEEDVHYKLDRTNKKLTWLFSKKDGGFDLLAHYKYLAIYDIYLADNGLTNPSQIEVQG